MKVDFDSGKWHIEKPRTELDLFVNDFVSILEKQQVNYVIVSGYVSILFGRSRNSEDVDLFVEKLDENNFKKLWASLEEEFECLNSPEPSQAYEEYLLNDTALRFAKKGGVIPNMELRFPKASVESWALDNHIQAFLNNRELNISPVELQIAYKLYLGSDKDFEDAKHLWLVCQKNLKKELLYSFIHSMKQERNASRWLK